MERAWVVVPGEGKQTSRHSLIEAEIRVTVPGVISK